MSARSGARGARLAAWAWVWLAACGEEAAPSDEAPVYGALDGVLRWNHVQAVGTHNSYHIEPDNVLDDSHRYTHLPLDEQLEAQRVRQLELDVHLHLTEGYIVHHLPLVDPKTTCRRLVDCLETVKAWSDANPWHLPILVWIEPKDEIEAAADLTRTEMLRAIELPEDYDQLDAEIASVFPPSRSLTPDALRGGDASLPEALGARGWPTLGELRGKVVFALLDSGEHRARYLERSQVLEGRAMFVDSDTPQDPFAAMFKLDNAPSRLDEVRARLGEGFLITSNTGLTGDDEGSQAQNEASLQAGSQYLSTDYPGPREDGGPWLDLPGRCNPVTAPAECEDGEVEPRP